MNCLKNPFVIPFLLLILFTGCNGTEPRVGLVSYNLNDPYIRVFAGQIEELSRGRFSLESHDALNSQMKQNELIENMIKEELDLLIINPVDRLGVYPIIRKLKHTETPVIFFNREPLLEDLQLWKDAYYVGARAEQSGQLQAQLVMELFGNDPQRLNRFDLNGDNRIQAVILKGEQGHQDAEIRTAQVVRSFRDRGFSFDILTTSIANWNEGLAYEKMAEADERFHGKMEVILSNNDAMALGAISYLRENGYFTDSNNNGRIDSGDDSWLPVVGIDGIDRAVEEIERGYLYGTVLNDSREQAAAIVELAEALLKNRDLSALSFSLVQDKYVWIDYKVFSIENDENE